MYPTLSKYFKFFPTHTTKKNDRKNGFTSKITSEMELDFGWKTSSRKSRLSLLFLVFYGSELKYVLVYNWNMEKFERRGSTQRRVSKIVILCWKPRKNDPCLLSARRAVMYQEINLDHHQIIACLFGRPELRFELGQRAEGREMATQIIIVVDDYNFLMLEALELGRSC